MSDSRLFALRQPVFAALYNVGFGAISIGFTVLVTRRLDVEEAGSTLVTWNVLLILGAILIQPAEIFAPRLAMEISVAGGRQQDVRCGITQLVVTGCLATLVMTSGWGLLVGHDLSWLASTGIVISGFGMLYLHRARLVAKAEYGRLTVVATGTAALTVLVTTVALVFEIGDSPQVLLVVSAAVFIVPIIAELADQRDRPFLRECLGLKRGPVSLPTMLSTTASLGVTSAVSLLLVAGGPPIGSLVGMDPPKLASYAVASSVASVPFIMLMSAMMPLVNRSVALVNSRHWGGLKILLQRSMGLLFLATIVLSIFGGLFGTYFLEVYLGSNLALSNLEVGAILLSLIHI